MKRDMPPGTTIPNDSGVYQILCVPTGIIYIGSAVNLRQRWSQHLRELHRGYHHNIHLQNAWNKYDQADFEFCVLEIVPEAELLSIEQKWIDTTMCTERGVGFNLSKTAGSPGDISAQVWPGFVDPDGNEVTITNLREFCRHHDLDSPSMQRLASGKSKLKSYKGWTHKNSVRQRDYIKTHEGDIDPDGNPVGPITNLAAFCREHGLDKTHMVAVAHGRICSHRGWTHVDGRQSEHLTRKYTGFINPVGQRVIITNITAFCRENGLDAVHMHEIKSGKRPSHKGWTWREEDGEHTYQT